MGFCVCAIVSRTMSASSIPNAMSYHQKKVDADAVELLGMLRPEVVDYLYGADESSFEAFLEGHPAPVDVLF